MELIECIERIPNRLNYVDSNWDDLSDSLRNYIDQKEINEIVFVASGSSYNAAHASKSFCLNHCHIGFRAIYPNDFLLDNQYVNEKALYVVISQGGTTKLVYDSLSFIKSKGLMNCTITEDLKSPIAKLGDYSIEMGSDNEEFIYRTIGYSTTLTRCYQIETIVSQLMNKNDHSFKTVVSNDLIQAINHLDSIREKTQQWYKENKFYFDNKTKIILAGASYLFPIANEADIKLMEMVPIMTRSFELEELIHGPQNAFDEKTAYFLLSDQEFDSEKTLAIDEFISKEIGKCVVVGDVSNDSKNIFFNYSSKHFKNLEIVTVFQVIAYLLAKEKGRDLKKGVNATISNYVKKQL